MFNIAAKTPFHIVRKLAIKNGILGFPTIVPEDGDYFLQDGDAK